MNPIRNLKHCFESDLGMNVPNTKSTFGKAHIQFHTQNSTFRMKENGLFERQP